MDDLIRTCDGEYDICCMQEAAVLEDDVNLRVAQAKQKRWQLAFGAPTSLNSGWTSLKVGRRVVILSRFELLDEAYDQGDDDQVQAYLRFSGRWIERSVQLRGAGELQKKKPSLPAKASLLAQGRVTFFAISERRDVPCPSVFSVVLAAIKQHDDSSCAIYWHTLQRQQGAAASPPPRHLLPSTFAETINFADAQAGHQAGCRWHSLRNLEPCL